MEAADSLASVQRAVPSHAGQVMAPRPRHSGHSSQCARPSKSFRAEASAAVQGTDKAASWLKDLARATTLGIKIGRQESAKNSRRVSLVIGPSLDAGVYACGFIESMGRISRPLFICFGGFNCLAPLQEIVPIAFYLPVVFALVQTFHFPNADDADQEPFRRRPPILVLRFGGLFGREACHQTSVSQRWGDLDESQRWASRSLHQTYTLRRGEAPDFAFPRLPS